MLKGLLKLPHSVSYPIKQTNIDKLVSEISAMCTDVERHRAIYKGDLEVLTVCSSYCGWAVQTHGNSFLRLGPDGGL